MCELCRKAPGKIAPKRQGRRQGQVRIGKTQNQEPVIGVGMILPEQLLLKLPGGLGLAIARLRPFQPQPTRTDDHL